MTMEAVNRLKKEANDSFNKGKEASKSTKQEADSYFKSACSTYGKAIEMLQVLEIDQQTLSSTPGVISLKPTLFLNLAMSNMHLLEYDGCRRCCNAAILLCWNPTMLLDDIGVDHDVTCDMEIAKTLPLTGKDRTGRNHEFNSTIVVKSVYWRGKANLRLKAFQSAVRDLEYAAAALPHDKQVAALLREAIQKSSEDARTHSSEQSIPLQSDNDSRIRSLTVNGGPCLYRTAYWSQSLDFATIYYPIESVEVNTIGDRLMMFKAINWDIRIDAKNVSIKCKGDVQVNEALYNRVDADASVWALEDCEGRDEPTHVAVYLRKRHFEKWYPGCEWWDRVFLNDEAIETLTCSIGTDYSELPLEAKSRSHFEHQRFQTLSIEEQQRELMYVENMKRRFEDSELKTRRSAFAEDVAIRELPMRSQINDLRAEFPHIDFTIK